MTGPATTRPKKVVAIIQSRMGSSRLPGKMLEPIAGRPLMYHIIARALRIRCAQEVYLATTDKPADDPLVALAQEMGIKVVRGPEDNVMERFFLAIGDSGADYIVRICGDAPLFDPEFIDRCAGQVLNQNADFVRLADPGPIAYQGASIISRRALEWSRDTAPDDPRTYEHVTAYAFAHGDQLHTVAIEVDPLYRGEFKLSIDTREDLDFIREVYSGLYEDGRIVSLGAALEYLKKHPEIPERDCR